MNIITAYDDPAIVDFYIDELKDFDFELLYSESESKRLDYGALEVYEGRKVVPPGELQRTVDALIESPVLEITKTLLSMDTKRYPAVQIDQFYKNKSIGFLTTIDSPGWSMPWHLDNRFIAVSGVINARDNDTQTFFAKSNYHWNNGGTDFSDCEIIHKGKKNKLWGTAWLNTEHTWHCVPQIITERHVLLFNVFFFK